MLIAYLVLLCDFFWEFSIFHFCRPLVDIYWHPLLRILQEIFFNQKHMLDIFWGICTTPPSKIKWSTPNHALSNSALKFRNALRCAYFGCLFSVMRGFTDYIWEGVRGILEFLIKRYKSCTNWRLELMQTNLLPFGCFRKSFIAHSTQLVFQCQMYNGWLLTLCSILPVPILYSDRKYMFS